MAPGPPRRRGLHRRRVHADRARPACRSSTSASCARTRPTTSSRSGRAVLPARQAPRPLLRAAEKLRLNPGRPRRPHARARRVRAPRGAATTPTSRRSRRGACPPGSRDIRLCVNQLILLRDPVRLAAHAGAARARPAPRGRRTERISNRAVDPRIKNYHWLDFEQALLSAYDAGGDNVVLPDGKGLVTEGAGFNVFVVRDGVLRTPATNVLEGITRHDRARHRARARAASRRRRGQRRRAAQRRRGVRREHGGRRLLRHLGGRDAARRRAHRPGHAAHPRHTGPGTTTRASRSRSPTCRRSRPEERVALCRSAVGQRGLRPKRVWRVQAGSDPEVDGSDPRWTFGSTTPFEASNALAGDVSAEARLQIATEQQNRHA